MGGEYTVGNTSAGGDMIALPTIKIELATEFYDMRPGHNCDDTCHPVPLRFAGGEGRRKSTGAHEAFRVIGGRGWGGRFPLDDEGTTTSRSGEHVPGMTDHLLVPMAARANGLDYRTLVRQGARTAAND